MTVFLESPRLFLRRLTENDLDALVLLDSDPEVMRYLTGGQPTPREVMRDEKIPRLLGFYRDYDHYGFWACIERATGDFLGWFHMKPFAEIPEEIELGYRLKRSAWGKGYATEMEKIGMRFEKDFTETQFPGANKAAVKYGIDRETYRLKR